MNDSAAVPDRVIDAHFHIIDPAFPLTPNDGYLPEPFTAADYTRRVDPLPVAGGAVVAGSFQGLDTSWVAPVLTAMGPRFRAVVNLSPDVSDAQIAALDAAGARAMRINIYRGSDWDRATIERMARRVRDVAGWHTEFYLDAATLADEAELLATLEALPLITVDHFGMSEAPDVLLRLAGAGHIVKATGLGRIKISDPQALTGQILAENSRGLMFGTDLPSTRARTPYSYADAQTIAAWAGPHAGAVFHDTAAALYGTDIDGSGADHAPDPA